MAERIPPLTPRPSKELARYEEIKRLAEMAWVGLIACHLKEIAAVAWDEAEAMYAESQRRRPHE